MPFTFPVLAWLTACRLRTAASLTFMLCSLALAPAAQAFDHVAATQRYQQWVCLLYTSPSPRDVEESRMPSSA